MISRTTTAALLSFCMIAQAQAAPRKANYDEAKAGPYTLPDPLRMENGDPVRDARTWREKRRPEILHLFETHVYGRAPGQPASLSFENTSEDKNALGGIATRREIRIYLTKD